MKRVMVLLAAGATLLSAGGGVASAGVSGGGPSLGALNQSLNQGLQQALVSQTSAIIASAMNSANAGGNSCFGGCPSVAVANNLLNATSLNLGVVTQAMTQVSVSFDNVGSPMISLSGVGSPTISIVGIQLGN